MPSHEPMRHSNDCIFCHISTGEAPASVIHAEALTMSFLDLRQFHPGHVLVIPRRHIPDIRSADDATASAIAVAVARAARSVDRVFPNDGLSIWHSVGPGANQEVPHLHFHIHPRRLDDNLLRVYPAEPDLPARETLDEWAWRLKEALAEPMP